MCEQEEFGPQEPNLDSYYSTKWGGEFIDVSSLNLISSFYRASV